MKQFGYNTELEMRHQITGLLVHDEDARRAVDRIEEQAEYLQRTLGSFDGSEKDKMLLEETLSENFNPPMDINNLAQYWSGMAAQSNPDFTPFLALLANLEGFCNAAQDAIGEADHLIPNLEEISKANLRIQELEEAATQLEAAREEFDRVLASLAGSGLEE